MNLHGRYSSWVKYVFNHGINATDKSKITSDQYRIQFDIRPKPPLGFRETPFKYY